MTAVEWLRKELETIPSYSAFYGNNYQWIDSIMNEAKEMGKQQIKSARHSGRQDLRDNGAMYKEDEQYYNETFKTTIK